MASWADYGKALGKHYEKHAADIGARKWGTMSKCMIHQITFGPVGPVEPGQHVHLLSGKPADVVDMQCPGCGEKLFIYYRDSSAGVTTSEDEEKGNTQ